MPPSMVCLPDDHALGTDTYVVSFEGMADGDMRDLFGRPDDQHAEDGMPECRLAGVGRLQGSSLTICRIKFIELAHIVAGSTHKKNVPVDMTCG
ncbi:hypothetical protein [Rhizobium leguminosarum]